MGIKSAKRKIRVFGDLKQSLSDALAYEQSKLAALRAAIDAGDASGISEGDVFARVRKSLKLPRSSR